MAMLGPPLCPFAIVIGFVAASYSTDAQQPADTTPVHLTVDTGTPIRLYLTKRVFFHRDAPVTAKFLAPVWTFDRVTIPAGSTAAGRIVSLQPVPKLERAMAVVRGDFTPLKRAEIAFDAITFPDGKKVSLSTTPAIGLGSTYVEPKPQKPKAARKSRPKPIRKKKAAETPKTPSRFAQARQFARQQAEAAATARTQGFFGAVHAPNRKEWLEEFLLNKLPYHPQWYPRGERFDAILNQPLDFGTVQVSQSEFSKDNLQLGREQAAMLRLQETISSADAKPGDAIRALLAEPLFTAAHSLVLPQGTEFSGRVTLAKRARMFHRAGKLRFTFNQLATPAEMRDMVDRKERTHAQLDAVEQADTTVAVDEEGTAKATESKTRFLRPAVAFLVASRSMDNDAGKAQASGANANYSGRSLGGFSGLGLFGTLAVTAPKPVGSALGVYGLAWSVYSTVISRGKDVVFEKNTAVQVRFGER